jgi:hypothetical protein
MHGLQNAVVFNDTDQIIYHMVYRGFVKDYTIWTKHKEGSSSPYMTGNPENIDDRFQFIHETQQPLPQSENVVPNVTDHGYARGNERDRTYVLPNVMDEEDVELLKEILCRHTDPSMFFHERYGVPEEGSKRAFVRRV